MRSVLMSSPRELLFRVRGLIATRFSAHKGLYTFDPSSPSTAYAYREGSADMLLWPLWASALAGHEAWR
ncbi:MAG: hypothetical protein ACREBC_38540, partial [Pyrinomonadaceae bacterium]